MSRKRAARRSFRAAVAVGAVAALSLSLGNAEEMVSQAMEAAVEVAAAADSSSLGNGSFFKPAGDVLRRTRAQVPQGALPFQTDTTGQGSRETLLRWSKVYSFARKYRIHPDLASKIFDSAVRAGIEPELGFRVVRIESEFKPTATSPVGAVGLMQIMPATARGFEPDITIDELYDPDTNLRIGFRYLRGLIRQYKGDIKLALLVYNRGPVAVENALALGIDPTNGYENAVMRGYKGRGTLD